MLFRGFLNTFEEVDTEYAKAIEKGVRFVLKPERVNNFSSEEVSRYEDFDPMSENQVKEIISEWKDMDNRLVAELKESHKVIGSVGYWIDEEGHHCIDYDFNPEFGKKGYATEACKRLIRYLFETKDISEIFGDCDVRNEASWKLMERLGFERLQRLDDQSYKNDVNNQPIMIQTYLYGLKREKQ